MILNSIIYVLLLTGLFSYGSALAAGTANFNATRDVWVSAYEGEENYNMGASDRLKLKGIQEMAILDFDLSFLKGKKIEAVRLYMRDTGRDNKLRKIGISTVATPWVEGKSRGYFVDVLGRGATFDYASYKRRTWAGDGSDLTDVTMGIGNTWHHHTEIKREGNGWWSVDAAPGLIHAMMAGKSHGLLVMDESGQTFANNYVYSRESKYSPYLSINYSEFKKPRPVRPEVRVSSSPENAHMKYGALVLKVSVKESIFAFDMYIDGEEVPQWRIPRPGPVNTVQEIIVDWLPPNKKVNIKMTSVDEIGQRSDPAIVAGYSSGVLQRIDFSQKHERNNSIFSGEVAGDFKRESKHVNAWAVPDGTKIDPLTGEILSEPGVAGLRRMNPVWSEKMREISLTGIKGEVLGFQLCLESEDNAFNELGLEFSPLISGAGDKIMPDKVSMYKVHYLEVKGRWYPELAIPMIGGKMDKIAVQQSIRDQKNQLAYIEIHVPSYIPPGLYKGKVIVMQKGIVEETISVKLNVKGISMPGKLTFVPELNTYSGPGKAGTERFLMAHRIAHEHRMVINRVPYGQNGNVHSDMIPEISYLNNGKVRIDWTDYDRRFGPLFDGTAFAKEERKGIPVEKFYLPFFENWPAELASNYQYTAVKKKTKEMITEHALKAPPLDMALSSGYRDRVISVAQEFKKHFAEKGWGQTEFQFYLNNKWTWDGASSWWNLDEPVFYDDMMALKYFGDLFNQARGPASVRFVFRADISRPGWQYDWLNGTVKRMYVQDRAFSRYPDKVRRLKKEGGIDFSLYGSLNYIDASNQETVFLCMKAFVEGADGFLPWQSLVGPKAFTMPDRNALIVDPGKGQDADWIVSLRLKALRRGQQDVEMMNMLANKYGYNREQLRDLFYRYFDVDSNRNEMALVSKGISTYKMEEFRKLLIEML